MVVHLCLLLLAERMILYLLERTPAQNPTLAVLAVTLALVCFPSVLGLLLGCLLALFDEKQMLL